MVAGIKLPAQPLGKECLCSLKNLYGSVTFIRYISPGQIPINLALSIFAVVTDPLMKQYSSKSSQKLVSAVKQLKVTFVLVSVNFC